MSRTLAIVERAHRGSVEQQYAHVLWLAHALHRQSPMTVLLRGLAAMYALDTPPVPARRLGSVGGCSPPRSSREEGLRPTSPLPGAGCAPPGDADWGSRPDYGPALSRLRRDGAWVLVSASSLAELGIGGRPLHPAVRAVPDEDIATLVASHRRVWFL